MINSHFGFTPLKEVWLGDCYPLSYYTAIDPKNYNIDIEQSGTP